MTPNILGRLQHHLADAERDILLVAPFIKAHTTERLFAHIASEIDVTCVTRWRAEEVARGVSDLEVFDLCLRRPRTSLLLRSDLHAKYYRMDELCFVGSANLTDKGLGVGDAPNLEILIKEKASHEDLAEFESDLFEHVVPATAWIRDQVAIAARALRDTSSRGPITFRGSQAPSPGKSFSNWMPSCLVPSQLYSIYRGDRSRIADPVYQDALEDLEFLDPAPGLGADQFRSLVASRLAQHPIFAGILSGAKSSDPGDEEPRLAPSQAAGTDSRPVEEREALRKWIAVFFPRRHID